MEQIPSLFNNNQQLDKSELVDSLANKAPRSHKEMMISQGFNPKMEDLATFLEHCERAETSDNIAMEFFYLRRGKGHQEKNIFQEVQGA